MQQKKERGRKERTQTLQVLFLVLVRRRSQWDRCGRCLCISTHNQDREKNLPGLCGGRGKKDPAVPCHPCEGEWPALPRRPSRRCRQHPGLLPTPTGGRSAGADRGAGGLPSPPGLTPETPNIAVASTLRMLWLRPAQSQDHQGFPILGFALRRSQALVWISAFKLEGRLCVWILALPDMGFNRRSTSSPADCRISPAHWVRTNF